MAVHFYILFMLFASVHVCDYSTIDEDSLLKKYNLNSVDNKIIELPKKLQEVSGIAFLDENHLLIHNDEKGVVYKINILNGEVVSEFSIGNKEIEKDFEGIAVANDSAYLVTSSGNLFKFSLYDGKEEIKYEKISTPLSSRNNVEGLCYDENTNSLLLACKDDPGKGYKNRKSIYEFSLTNMKFSDKPRFLISLKKLKNNFNIKNFSPSGIDINPINVNIFLISANHEEIIELDSKGKILCAEELNKKKHKQPEGISFLLNGELIIADEAGGQKAKLTFIRLNK